ncbi:hypothetical protein D3C72_2380450 [compost metagenome]
MIGFSVIDTALGMANDNMRAKAIGNHFGRNVTGMGARFLLMAILRANQQRAVIAKGCRNVK